MKMGSQRDQKTNLQKAPKTTLNRPIKSLLRPASSQPEVPVMILPPTNYTRNYEFKQVNVELKEVFFGSKHGRKETLVGDKAPTGSWLKKYKKVFSV